MSQTTIETLRSIIWGQFGAAIDMLDEALRACPPDAWHDTVWDDPRDDPRFNQFWFVAYHTVRWLDTYVSGSPPDFAPPPPFLSGRLPEQPYTQADVLDYLARCREKCQAALESMTDEQAVQTCTFPWGEQMGYAELQLYCMRHVQEHAAQLSMHLGRRSGYQPDWVGQARQKTG
jgi:hypothetical protein